MENKNILRDEFSTFAGKVIDTLGDFQNYMDTELERIEQESKPEGIIIDHKTFAKLVNTLSYGVGVGTVEKDFFNTIVKLGMEQTKPTEKIRETDERPKMGIIALDQDGNEIDLGEEFMEVIGKFLNKR